MPSHSSMLLLAILVSPLQCFNDPTPCISLTLLSVHIVQPALRLKIFSNQDGTGAEQPERTLAAAMLEQSPGGPAEPGIASVHAGSWLPDVGKSPNVNSYCVLGTVISGISL